MRDKLVDLKDAIAGLVRDGDSVVLGACLEPMIPFAATHELIRQGKRDLAMIVMMVIREIEAIQFKAD